MLREVLSAYESEAGRSAYEETLASVQENFPQYVKEMHGTADGAQVPFHHVSDTEKAIRQNISTTQTSWGRSTVFHSRA